VTGGKKLVWTVEARNKRKIKAQEERTEWEDSILKNYERIYPILPTNKKQEKYNENFMEYVNIANEHYQSKCGTSKHLCSILLKVNCIF